MYILLKKSRIFLFNNQNMKRVAIQGVSGAFHEIAARDFFHDEEIDIVPCVSFKDIFKIMEKEPEVIGCMAIENTIAGSLLPNHDLIKNSGYPIIGEYKLRISHSLAVLPGQKLEDIHEVHSHPIALMQCNEFFEQHTHLKAVESDDTALSAKDITEGKILGRAAICSRFAAEHYGLEIIADGIETNKRNFTRFLMFATPNIAEQMIPKIKKDKSSLVFTLPHEEGSLAQVLAILSFYKLNLTKIQSLPILGQEFEYQFYINLKFDDYQRYRQALDAIRPLLKDFKILGEYKEAPIPLQNNGNNNNK